MNSRLTVLGFDFGLRRIGVAVGQLITQSASSLPILQASQGIPDWSKISKIIEDWKIGALVVGIPYNMDGSSQPITFEAEKFAEELYKRFELPVYRVDERLTTKEANQLFHENKKRDKKSPKTVDSIAAKIILESWLREQIKKECDNE